MIKAFFISICFSCLTCFETESQTLKPKAVTTPEVAMMEKFGNIPVSYYTGLAGISIPLYTIKVDGMQLPVTLKYHPSGIQVEQEATWVGLGWDLSVGGSIVQIPNGKIDQEDNVNPYKNTYDIMNANNTGHADDNEYAYFNNIEWCWMCNLEQKDLPSINNIRNGLGMPDIYDFNLPTGSGMFYLDPFTGKETQFGNKTSQFFISKNRNTDKYENEWTIEDTKGNVYFFSKTDNEFSNNIGSSSYYTGFTSRLSNITVPSGKTIAFNYIFGKYQIPTYTQSLTLDYFTQQQKPSQDIFGTEHSVEYLHVIETPYEKIVFNLSSTQVERADLNGYVVNNVDGAKRLNSIDILDKLTGSKIKTYEFNYDYFSCDLSFPGSNSSTSDPLTKRLKLVSIQTIGYKPDGSADRSIPPYRFEYNESYPLPRKDSYARDHWGYFNGQVNNTNFLPNLTNDILSGNVQLTDIFGNRMPDYVIKYIINSGGANKGMEPIYAQADILTKITYPTGGYSSFNYEPHSYKNYRTFSASEINNAEGYTYSSLVDMNTYSSNAQSPILYPDANGHLTLFDFHGGFNRVDQSIDYSNFLNCYVKIWRFDVSNNKTEVKGWQVTSDRNTFNASNGYQFPSEYIDIGGAVTDRYIVEAYLPDADIFTPQNGSLIPKATVSCTFSSKNTSTFTKESIGGGLRITFIENHNSAGELEQKTIYKYLQEDESTTSGKLMNPIKSFTYLKRILSTEIPQKGDAAGQRIYQNVPYAQVSSYSYIPMSQDAQGSIVGYDRVEVIQMDHSGNANGKTVYNYRNTPSEQLQSGSVSFGTSTPNIPHYDNGLLQSEKIYTASTTLIKETDYTYDEIENSKKRFLSLMDVAYGQSASEYLFGRCADPPPQQCVFVCSNDISIGFFPNGQWHAISYPLNTKWFVPSSVSEVQHTPTQSLTAVKSFHYNSLGQVVHEEVANSKNQIKSVDYTYPIDVPNPDPVVQMMINKNLLDYLQGQVTKMNGSVELSRIKNTYAQTPSGDVQPVQIQQSNNGGAFYDAVSDIKYDSKNNLIQFNKNGDITSYIWDYNQNIRIADVLNASYTDVAYTSFEADGMGNWDGINTANIQIGGGISGDNCYNQNNSSISKSNLDAAKNYVITYWSKTGPFAVSGTLTGYPKVLGSVQLNGYKWTLYEHIIAGQSTATLSGNGSLDELRLYPKQAQMVTYTYKPLIGLTTQCDANNRITFYEFDALGRLSVVRDQNNNILKKICYNYQGQIEACSLGCTSLVANWQNTATPIRCKKDASNQNTGEQEQEQKDINPCSSTYNTIRWVVIATNTTACPLPLLVIYARLTYENTYYGYDGSYWGDVVVRFYSDAAGAQPISVSNLTVNYTIGYEYDNSIAIASAVANGTYIVLQNSAQLTMFDPRCDPNYMYCTLYNVNYSINTGAYSIIY